MVASDGYNSYAMFIYMDRGLQWVQAQLKPQVPEVAAQAGFDSGTQTYAPVILPDSGLPGAKDWNRLVGRVLFSWTPKLPYFIFNSTVYHCSIEAETIIQ